MRYVGECFDVADATGRVREAIVTDDRVAIDWQEEGNLLHFSGTSLDGGRTFSGHYGAPQPDERFSMTLTRYKAADGTVILFGTWLEKDDGQGGILVFRLKPGPAARAGKPSGQVARNALTRLSKEKHKATRVSKAKSRRP